MPDNENLPYEPAMGELPYDIDIEEIATRISSYLMSRVATGKIRVGGEKFDSKNINELISYIQNYLYAYRRLPPNIPEINADISAKAILPVVKNYQLTSQAKSAKEATGLGLEQQTLALREAQFKADEAQRAWERAQSEKLSPWQQAQLEQNARQSQLDFERQRLATQGQQAELGVQQLVGMHAGNPEIYAKEQLEKQRVQYEQEFEKVRQQMLNELTGPQNWISRWLVQAKPNPYYKEPEAESADASAQAKLETAKSILDTANAIDQKISNPKDNLTYEKIKTGTDPYSVYARGIMESVPWARDQMAEAQAEIARASSQTASSYGRGTQQSMPALPPTPAWLTEFAPGTTRGAPITKANLQVPSGQQWSGTPWSVKEGLSGYSKWSGQSLEDLLGEMQRQLPNTPRLPSGWRPASQKVSV